MNREGKLTLRVISPERIILEKEGLNAVNIPLADGYPIGIRPGHAPLIAETIKGIVQYRTNQQENEIHLHAGVMNLRENIINVLTAGEVDKTPESLAESVPTEFDRLMQTLIHQVYPEEQHEEELP